MKKLFIILLSLTYFISCGKDKITLYKDNPKIVAFGDSLTAGYGANEGESYPDYLKNHINWEIINRGRSGDTTFDGVNRLNQVKEDKGDIVILGLGANDYFRQLPISDTKDNLNYIIEELLNDGVEVIFLVKFYPKKSLFFLLQKNKKEAYDNMYKDLEREGVIIIENMWDNVFGEKDLMSDEIHPNKNGYKIFADNIYKSLNKDVSFE